MDFSVNLSAIAGKASVECYITEADLVKSDAFVIVYLKNGTMKHSSVMPEADCFLLVVEPYIVGIVPAVEYLTFFRSKAAAPATGGAATGGAAAGQSLNLFAWVGSLLSWGKPTNDEPRLPEGYGETRRLASLPPASPPAKAYGPSAVPGTPFAVGAAPTAAPADYGPRAVPGPAAAVATVPAAGAAEFDYLHGLDPELKKLVMERCAALAIPLPSAGAAGGRPRVDSWLVPDLDDPKYSVPVPRP